MSSTVEPEWDEAERQWMLSLRHYRAATLCRLCGMPKEVCRAYETDGMVSVEFERCHVTAALARKQRALQQEGFDLPESLSFSAGVVATT